MTFNVVNRDQSGAASTLWIDAVLSYGVVFKPNRRSANNKLSTIFLSADPPRN